MLTSALLVEFVDVKSLADNSRNYLVPIGHLAPEGSLQGGCDLALISREGQAIIFIALLIYRRDKPLFPLINCWDTAQFDWCNLVTINRQHREIYKTI